MENTNNAMSEIHDEIGKIDGVVDGIVGRIDSSVDTSGHILADASYMQKEASSAYESGQTMLVESRKAVDEAIERLSSLGRINDLAEEILSISSRSSLTRPSGKSGSAMSTPHSTV